MGSSKSKIDLNHRVPYYRNVQETETERKLKCKKYDKLLRIAIYILYINMQ